MNNSQKIIKTADKMVKLGLVKGTWGNISVREDNKVWITPSGTPYDELREGDIAVIDFETGNQIDGSIKASSEIPMHLAIYKNFPSIHGVVHTHSTYATVFASMDRLVKCYVEDQAQIIGGDIEVAKYAFPGTEELGRNVVDVLKSGKFGALLSKHGAVGVGRSIDEAMIAAQIVEKSSKIAFLIELLKGESTLSNEDVDKMRKIYLEKYSANLL